MSDAFSSGGISGYVSLLKIVMDTNKYLFFAERENHVI